MALRFSIQAPYMMGANISGDIWQSRQMTFQARKKREAKSLKALLFASLKSCGVGSLLYGNVICCHKGHGNTPRGGGVLGWLFSALHFFPSAWMLESRQKYGMTFFFSFNLGFHERARWPCRRVFSTREAKPGGFTSGGTTTAEDAQNQLCSNEAREDSNTLHRCRNSIQSLTPQIHQNGSQNIFFFFCCNLKKPLNLWSPSVHTFAPNIRLVFFLLDLTSVRKTIVPL